MLFGVRFDNSTVEYLALAGRWAFVFSPNSALRFQTFCFGSL